MNKKFGMKEIREARMQLPKEKPKINWWNVANASAVFVCAFSRRNLTQTINTLYKKCDINASGFHVLRHTFGSKLYEKDVDVKTISELMGHSNISITANVYVHLSPDSKINAVKILNF